MSLSDNNSFLPIIRGSKFYSEISYKYDEDNDDFTDDEKDDNVNKQDKLQHPQKPWSRQQFMKLLRMFKAIANKDESYIYHYLCFCRTINGKNIGFSLPLAESSNRRDRPDAYNISPICDALISIFTDGQASEKDESEEINYSNNEPLLDFVTNLLEKIVDLMSSKKLLGRCKYTGNKWEIFDDQTDEIFYLATIHRRLISKIDDKSFVFSGCGKDTFYRKDIVYVTSEIGEITASHVVDLLVYDGMATNEIIIAKIYPQNEETTKLKTTQNTKKQKTSEEDNNNNNNNNITSTTFEETVEKKMEKNYSDKKKDRDDDDDNDDDNEANKKQEDVTSKKLKITENTKETSLESPYEKEDSDYEDQETKKQRIENYQYSKYIIDNWQSWRQTYKQKGVIAVGEKDNKVWGWGEIIEDAACEIDAEIERTNAKNLPIFVVFLDLTHELPTLKIPEVLIHCHQGDNDHLKNSFIVFG